MAYFAHDFDHILIAQLLSDIEGGLVFWVTDDLHQPLAIAKVDEDQPTVVSAAVYPATQGDFLVNLLGINLVAIVCTHGAHIYIKGSW